MHLFQQATRHRLGNTPIISELCRGNMPATFTDNEVTSRLKDKRRLSAWLDDLVTTELEGIKRVKLQYVFCTDDYLLTLNEQYLQHDTYTDIITFDLSDNEREVVGEMYISVDRVADNANQFGVTYNEELHRVIFHGALHLCGYGDKADDEIAEMRRKEQACLKAWFSSQQQ